MDITFIGGGNMASALISGLLQQGYTAKQLHVVEINAENREKIKHAYGVSALADLESGVADADVIVLAVKPQHLHELSQRLSLFLKHQLVISIAAGICSADIERWLGGYLRIVRAMPNTPCSIQSGVTGLYAGLGVNEEDKRIAQSILAAVGTTLWVENEDMLHAITAISGSGPAYVFYFIESLQKAAFSLGFSPENAKQLSLQTFLGASKLANLSEEDVAILRAKVTSKGGTTEQAIETMEQEDIQGKILVAVRAAMQKSYQISDEYSKL
ncbi:MAG: pyrroline-5-carboxylate reductase [Nitrosomonas sp.]